LLNPSLDANYGCSNKRIEKKSTNEEGCVTLWPCHFHKKKGSILRQKEDLWKFKYFTMQKYNLKKSSKRNQNPSRYYNFVTKFLEFRHKPKLSSFKNPDIKIDLLLLP
jgi:hypothetical protein